MSESLWQKKDKKSTISRTKKIKTIKKTAISNRKRKRHEISDEKKENENNVSSKLSTNDNDENNVSSKLSTNDNDENIVKM